MLYEPLGVNGMPDGGQGQKRHWLQSIFNGQQKSAHTSGESVIEEENPWFALQDKEPSRTVASGAATHRTPVRWMTDESSPNGFSDDDGTLKQIENPVWRRAFGNKRSTKGRFVPRESTSSRWTSGASQSRTHGSGTRGSTWLMQTVAAAVLVAGGVYVHHMHTPMATQVGDVYQSAFTKDDSIQLWPAVDTFLTNHHIPVPAALEMNSTIRFHSPINGTVVTGYSSNHPELTYSAAAGAKVYAAGSGTVTKVETGAGIIVIDHGSIGETIYSKVLSIAVKKGEFVSSGQVIGHLKTSGKPTLDFAFEQGGQTVNPASYINGAKGGI
jgi:murein DD-endopeptidase MepM/ murein hydrolase activator NlpD